MLLLRTSPSFAPEKSYACTVLLEELLGIPCKVELQPDLEHYHLQLPNGAELILEDHFWGKIPGEQYLSEDNIPGAVLRLKHPFNAGEDIIALYGRAHLVISDRQISCGADLFASAFFLLTRWEEAVLPQRDEYGRFPASAALAWREHFLDRPLVNEYAGLLYQMLVHLGWNQPPKSTALRLQLSHDVDHPRLWWSATDRLRTLGGSVFQRKSGREAAWWMQNHLFRQQDPYDIFDEWMDWSEKINCVSHFNFLGERPANSDCYYPLQHPFVRDLMQKITDRGHKIGFHPSREAHADPGVFQRELASLQAVAPQAVRSGRQHYLCFSTPDTWQRWSDAGMDWDSTLGYPEAEGFRCGICCEFPVFQIHARQTLPLREKPLIAMDVTLARYRGYAPEEALDHLQQLRRQVAKHGGEFTLLWHNSSWNTYFWAPWKKIYQAFTDSF